MDSAAIHIHRPAEYRYRCIRRCRRCRASRRHVVTLYAYYGPIVYCCHCGAFTNDGELRRARRYDANLARIARQTWPLLPPRHVAIDALWADHLNERY